MWAGERAQGDVDSLVVECEERGSFWSAEGRVASIYDIFEVSGGRRGRRDSDVEIYRERSSKANSAKDRFFHFDRQWRGIGGISSGMESPSSAARPFRTTSSIESCGYSPHSPSNYIQWVDTHHKNLLMLTRYHWEGVWAVSLGSSGTIGLGFWLAQPNR
jgi:hypothetical protein